MPSRTAPGDPFPTALRELRAERGRSQVWLAEAVDVSQATVAKWERGAIAPTVEAIEGLVRALRPDDPAGFRFLAYLQHVPPPGRKHFKGA